jgi:uncharacterized protein YndB with AHSA1/START domain
MSPSAEVTLPSDREICLSRRFKASLERVFAAYTQPPLLQRWMLGPPGWYLPVCEVDLREGGTYRYVWRKDDGSTEFGAAGVYLELAPPRRIVMTQRMFGPLASPAPQESRLTIELREEAGVTIATTTICAVSKAHRDAALASGMAGGMEQSYSRLESAVLNPPDAPPAPG